MEKRKYIFFVFTMIILLFFFFEFLSSQTMDKKQGSLIHGQKHSVELTERKNAEFADKIHIKSTENNKENFTKDISDLNAWKVEVGDIDGDGIDEVALGVYTKSPLHQIDAKRPYIYKFNGEELIPKWRGSRLSRPFIDFVFYDLDKDGWDEIISIEILKEEGYIINSYKWKGFGFEGYLESEELETLPILYNDNNSLYIGIKGEEGSFKLEIDQENQSLEWRKENEG